MSKLIDRRQFLLSIGCLPVLTACNSVGTKLESNIMKSQSAMDQQFQLLEQSLNGRLGVYALNTANNVQIGYRAEERFPFCSTFKVIVAAAILKMSMKSPDLMLKTIEYQTSDLVEYSPITQKHVNTGMTAAELCAAALQYSDNTAANLLMKLFGGPAAVTAFAKSIGDTTFRLDRWETELNTAIPGDNRDTSSPKAMGLTLQKLLTQDALTKPQQEQLINWLLGNTTGNERIRAGLPKDWKVGDKTGTGSYGTANDVAIAWPANKPPTIICIYTTQHIKDAKPRSDIIAAATKEIVKNIG